MVVGDGVAVAAVVGSDCGCDGNHEANENEVMMFLHQFLVALWWGSGYRRYT